MFGPEFISYYAAQRELDKIPCRVCGGDMLMADFRSTDRCHVIPATEEAD